MAIYSLAVRTTATTSTALEVLAGANVAYRMLEFGVTIAAATASQFALYNSTTTSVAGVPALVVQAEDGGNTTTGNTVLNTSWTTSPNLPSSNSYRRVSLPATIGSGIIWTFPRGIIALKATSRSLNNITTNSTADVWVVVDE